MKTLAAAALAGAAAMVQAATPWVLTGALTTHDPNLYKTSSTWWVFEATSNGGIGVKYSSDGKAWTQGGPIFSSGLAWWKSYNPSADPAQVWAPGCGEYNGNGYCYYAVSTFGSQKSAIGLATSAGGIAAGAWVDQGAVITSASGSGYNAIDPSILVTDDSGNPWRQRRSQFAQGACTDRAVERPTQALLRQRRDELIGVHQLLAILQTAQHLATNARPSRTLALVGNVSMKWARWPTGLICLRLR